MSKPLYVFDLDETLINGDSAMLWNRFMVRKKLTTDSNFIAEDQRLMALYAKGELDMSDYLAFSLAPLQNMPAANVQRLVDECVEQDIAPRFYPQALELIAALRARGVDMLIISATASFIVSRVAMRLGIHHVLGIDLQMNNDTYTPQVAGVASFREGKVVRLQQWLSARDCCYDEVHFYTDSINDLPLCRHADHVHLVNPDPQLRAYSAEHNWQVLNWA